MDAFTRTVRIGTIDTGRGRRASIHCKISFDGTKLSIAGVIGALPSGNALGGCGQICMEFARRNPARNDSRFSHPITPREIKFAPGWNAAQWYDFLDVWDKWHLNDMRAGTPAQEMVLDAHGITDRANEYRAVCAFLAEQNIYDDNGDLYGHKWHTKQVPEDVLQFLYGLPVADIMPAWI